MREDARRETGQQQRRVQSLLCVSYRRCASARRNAPRNNATINHPPVSADVAVIASFIKIRRITVAGSRDTLSFAGRRPPRRRLRTADGESRSSASREEETGEDNDNNNSNNGIVRSSPGGRRARRAVPCTSEHGVCCAACIRSCNTATCAHAGCQ